MRKYIKIIFLWGIITNNCFGHYVRPFDPYYSQGGQDKYLIETVFKHKKNGVFFDIGAHDGISYSNTYYFEKMLDWTGVCVEPQSQNYQQLIKNRDCLCIYGGIFDTAGELEFIKFHGPSEMLSGLSETYDPRHLERAQKEIKALGGTIEVLTIKTFLLNDICAKNNISHIDFKNIDISVIAVENNYYESEIRIYLEEKGYTLLTTVSGDDIYIKKNFNF